jgi:hypothetical protein
MPETTTPPRPSTAPARHDALDRLRGAALVMMLVHHLVDWLTRDARAVLPGWPSFAVTDVAAVAFFLAAGASMALFVASRRQRGVPRGRVAAQVLRRYGLLVPIGMALGWLLWRNPFMFGVLEALGLAVVLGAAVVALVPARWLPGAAVATLVAGMTAEWLAGGHTGWVAREVIAGKFPLVTYVGFVAVGAAVVRTGRHVDRRWAAMAAAVGAAGTLALVVAGVAPDRYPGGVPFVLPGLAGTAILFALAQVPWPGPAAVLDRVVRRAAAHTLGIFVAHYAIYALLRDLGLLGDVRGAVAVPAAVAVTVTICLMAPRMPRPPWSLRTGRLRRPAAAGEAPATPPGPHISAANMAASSAGGASSSWS